MPEVATAQSVEQRFTPSSEQVQKHDEFRHIMILLLLATTINYGHAALPDPAYQLQFHSLGGFFFFFFFKIKIYNAVLGRNPRLHNTSRVLPSKGGE